MCLNDLHEPAVSRKEPMNTLKDAAFIFIFIMRSFLYLLNLY